MHGGLLVALRVLSQCQTLWDVVHSSRALKPCSFEVCLCVLTVYGAPIRSSHPVLRVIFYIWGWLRGFMQRIGEQDGKTLRIVFFESRSLFFWLQVTRLGVMCSGVPPGQS